MPYVYALDSLSEAAEMIFCICCTQDAEARIQLLRDRADTSKKGKRRLEEENERELLTKSTNEHIEETAKAKGHINFFEDLEMVSAMLSAI